jgi:hypothetical protein
MIGLMMVILLSVVGLVYAIHIGSLSGAEIENKKYNQGLVLTMVKERHRMGVLKRQKQVYIK